MRGFSEKLDKWKIVKTIKEFRNIVDIDFEFVRGGITIIVGENNIGKTNILDFLYEENKKWDDFEADEEEYKKEESPQGLIPRYRDSTYSLKLFFPRQAFLIYPNDLGRSFSFFKLLDCWLTTSIPPYFIHATHPEFKKRPKEGKITLSYRIYYFDLATATSFLNEEEKKGLRLDKVKFRNCEFYYGKLEESNSAREYFIIESGLDPKEEMKSWMPRFDNRDNFIKHQNEKKIIYYGLNKNISHPLDKLGSGYLKIETLKSLISDLKNEQQIQEGERYRYEVEKDKWLDEDEWKWKKAVYPKFIHTPILLMDEPEVFLHPSLISELASTIKKAEENNVTTIFTTHSPSLLSHFINELFSGEANLVILQKDESGKIKKPLCFNEIIEEVNKEICEVWKSYCSCFKEEAENNNFYYDKWKILLNEHTLKIFFSKSVLFVEGMTDYVLLVSEFIRREIPELESIEIIPIFGKLNYIFFSKLSQKMGIKCRFLLDKDNHLIEKAKRIESEEKIKGTKLKNCKHEPKCTQEQVHKTFWSIHTKGKLEGKEEEIIYDGEGEIDWLKDSIEYLLEVEPKDKFMISKELSMLNKLGSLDELKRENPENYKKWKERVSKLRRVVEKIV
ncbi:ATP-dependent nuclease [endosymbiont GvMRE of Glomus versiforme]|uniref:ATP-dependent nuclease n=1 Tax=endosymbiont GvMRE of Glomus versiforme TaxID=2039283 RepID=UPI000ED5910E|nr:AAA family ATPase [endosymbiont GvMRE of Glomus versiforme]RHZ36554.1 ATP-dependent endonuclease [endosymbiont GvMRE of Glomus versiforme]